MSIDYTALYFEDKGLKVSVQRIEPFDMSQARNFIDKHSCDNKNIQYDVNYKKLRDYILDKVQAFFKNQSDLERQQRIHFLGYAPVLMAIATSIKKNKNYYGYLTQLENSQNTGLELILEIVKYIIDREQNDKIANLLIPHITKGRGEKDIRQMKDHAYCEEEQCYRLICNVLGISCDYIVSDDNKLNERYNERINEWVREHPFLDSQNHDFQNIVFECYVLSVLMKCGKYKEYVNLYLESKYKDSYMLYFIYTHFANVVDKDHVDYIYHSLSSLDQNNDKAYMQICQLEDSEQYYNFEVLLKNDGIKTKAGLSLSISKDTPRLTLRNIISNVIIDAENIDLNIEVANNSKNIEIYAPVTITCNNVSISGSITLYPCTETVNGVLLDCKKFDFKSVANNECHVINHLRENEAFEIYSNNHTSFPYEQYRQGKSEIKCESEDIRQKYIKLRKIIICFRSHSKGSMARYKGKIGSSRLIGSDMGPIVLNSLIESGIIDDSDNIMYFLNRDKLSEVLGVTYDEIKSNKLTPKISSFLGSMK